MGEILFPSIITSIDGHDRSINTISYDFIKNRIIYITGEINDLIAMSIISQLRYLSGKSDDDITIIINSFGGSVTSGMAIYDTIKYGIRCDVVMVAIGMTASMAAFLLAVGSKGKRYATNGTEIMIHQPWGGVQGQATDILLVAEHIQQVKHKIASILAEECNKPLDRLLHDMERDHWMTSVEAMQYGLIDKIGYPDCF